MSKPKTTKWICSQSDCEEAAIARGYCQRHYMQERRGTLGLEQQPKAERKSDLRTEVVALALSKSEKRALVKAVELRGHRSISALIRNVLQGAALIGSES